MPGSDLCVQCNSRPKFVDKGKTLEYCGKSCADKAKKGVPPEKPVDNNLCENCHEKPKFKEANGRLHQYCGRACANAAQATPSLEEVNLAQVFSRSIRKPPVNLSQALASELKIAKSSKADVNLAIIESFTGKGDWQLKDATGSSDIVLQREFQGEHITVTVSLNDTEPLDDGFEEGDDYEEEEGHGDAEGDEPFAETDEMTGPGAIPCVISITKPRKGALLVKAIAIDGHKNHKAHFILDNVTHSNNVKVATSDDAEADYGRQKLYIAPQFEDLVEDLRTGFIQYLQARGITEDLAEFLLEYAKLKESRERTHWLEGLHSFFS